MKFAAGCTQYCRGVGSKIIQSNYEAMNPHQKFDFYLYIFLRRFLKFIYFGDVFDNMFQYCFGYYYVAAITAYGLFGCCFTIFTADRDEIFFSIVVFSAVFVVHNSNFLI